MKISEMTSLSSSASCKGFKQDTKQEQQLKRRQRKRSDIDDISEFEKIMTREFPQFYGKGEF